MTYHFSHQSVVPVVGLTAIVFALCSSPAAGQVQREAPGFWGLRPGNEFTVLVASSRRTEISVDGKPDVIRESSESQRIQYRVVAIDRSGDVTLTAVVQKMERNPPSPVLARLAGAAFPLTVQPSGRVSTTSPDARDALVTYLSNGDPESAMVLKKCLTDESIASWFNAPFWLIPTAEAGSGKSWEYTNDMSLGTLGTVHLDLNFQPEEARDRFSTVDIVGNARFSPLVLPDATERAAFPFWSNPSVEIDSVTGTGRMAVTSVDSDEPVRRRPGFESVELTVGLHGTAQVPRAQAKPAAAPSSDPATSAPQVENQADVSSVRFRMTQNHVWTLQSYSIGSPRMFDSGGVPIPTQ